MKGIFTPILCLLATTSSLFAQDGLSSYIGTWVTEGREIVLVFEEAGSELGGQVSFEGGTHAVAAKMGGELLRGSYDYGGAPVPFAAVLRDEYLLVESGGEVFALSRLADHADAAETAGTVSLSSDHPEAREWAEWFEGCRLSYFNRYDSGYGGGGYSDNTVVDLCPGYFRYNDQSETVFNAGDLSGSDVYTSNSNRGSGNWGVVMQSGEPALRLQFHDGSTHTYVLSYKDNETFLDGRRWLRTCNPQDSVVEARPNCP